MITEEISDLVKTGVAFGLPATSFIGVPLQDWMYGVSIFAALLLICERLPSAYRSLALIYKKVRSYGTRTEE